MITGQTGQDYTPKESRPVNIELPEVKMAEGISNAQNGVVSAVADGKRSFFLEQRLLTYSFTQTRY